MVPPSIVAPYVRGGLEPETLAALDRSGIPWRPMPLPPGDPSAYSKAFQRLWQRGESFIIVEQDMAPRPGQLHRLAHCSHRWCGYPYMKGEARIVQALGLTLFSAALMADHPTAAAQACHRPRLGEEWTPWWSLDMEVARVLRIFGEEWQAHQPDVAHVGGR